MKPLHQKMSNAKVCFFLYLSLEKPQKITSEQQPPSAGSKRTTITKQYAHQCLFERVQALCYQLSHPINNLCIQKYPLLFGRSRTESLSHQKFSHYLTVFKLSEGIKGKGGEMLIITSQQSLTCRGFTQMAQSTRQEVD